MKRKLENSPTFLRLIKNIRGEVQREEQENYFIIPCYFIESGFRTRFNHGLTSSVFFSSFAPAPSPIPIGSVLGITGNSQLFREREA